ncbi:MAG TPA: polyprenol monophosphomannose synthase [Bacteroidia bacterium]|nr:polyprenol monophosphomannose synthase [Bacteroidia bacterium]
MPKNLVIIPTYNEIENIDKMIREVMALPGEFHVLVVDDGSPDGTALTVKGLQGTFQHKLFLKERSGKLGLGTAYILGFKWALENSYEYIFEMDCDFSHNPKDLLRLLEACEKGADLAIGSRYCKGGQVHNWPYSRILMSYFASVYVRLVLWLPVKDTTAGFKCYKRIVLEKIDLDKIRFMGYAFQIEMKYKAYKAGFRIVEVPIKFTDRVLGVSKMSTRIFKEAFLGVLQMKFSA